MSQVNKGDADKESQAEPRYEDVLGQLLWHIPDAILCIARFAVRQEGRNLGYISLFS